MISFGLHFWAYSQTGSWEKAREAGNRWLRIGVAVAVAVVVGLYYFVYPILDFIASFAKIALNSPEFQSRIIDVIFKTAISKFIFYLGFNLLGMALGYLVFYIMGGIIGYISGGMGGYIKEGKWDHKEAVKRGNEYAQLGGRFGGGIALTFTLGLTPLGFWPGTFLGGVIGTSAFDLNGAYEDSLKFYARDVNGKNYNYQEEQYERYIRKSDPIRQR